MAGKGFWACFMHKHAWLPWEMELGHLRGLYQYWSMSGCYEYSFCDIFLCIPCKSWQRTGTAAWVRGSEWQRSSKFHFPLEVGSLMRREWPLTTLVSHRISLKAFRTLGNKIVTPESAKDRTGWCMPVASIMHKWIMGNMCWQAIWRFYQWR